MTWSGLLLRILAFVPVGMALHGLWRWARTEHRRWVMRKAHRETDVQFYHWDGR